MKIFRILAHGSQRYFGRQFIVGDAAAAMYSSIVLTFATAFVIVCVGIVVVFGVAIFGCVLIE